MFWRAFAPSPSRAHRRFHAEDQPLPQAALSSTRRLASASAGVRRAEIDSRKQSPEWRDVTMALLALTPVLEPFLEFAVVPTCIGASRARGPHCRPGIGVDAERDTRLAHVAEQIVDDSHVDCRSGGERRAGSGTS